MNNRLTVKLIAACALAAAAAAPAFAQTKLKWAHVYETSEPYHKWSVWAGEEFKKRTNGKYEIQVFPASSLGKESDINQGLQLGTVDIIITGANGPIQVLVRPRLAADPYATGIPGVYICSAATPPGPGAHGMCGANAAQLALDYLNSGKSPHRS